MDKLNRLMQENKISMYKLSKLTGIPKTTINDICTGKTSIERCSAINIKKIAEVLGCRMEDLFMNKSFHTNVLINERLKAFIDGVDKYEKRDCFRQLNKYLYRNIKDRICTIYGLRRTGKTTMIRQAIYQMDENMFRQAAYIKVNRKDKLTALNQDLDNLYENGFRYVFIDEVTLMDDFIDCASLFSDVYASIGMKIILSGTDSLGFYLASGNELYDRDYIIHTTYISFAEYSRLLKSDDIDKYIQYGGTLRMGETDYDDDELMDDGISFRDDETTRRYIDTAIARNIQNSLKNFENGDHFRSLYELYENNELTNAINRVIQDQNHRFLESTIIKNFKSYDYGKARHNILRNTQKRGEMIDIEDFMNKEEILTKLIKVLDIKRSKDDLIVKNNSLAHVNEIKEYLRKLELIEDAKIISLTDKGDMSEENYTIFKQPGMRYSQVDALVYYIMKDELFLEQPNDLKQYIRDSILNTVKGVMLEDIVLYDRLSKANKSEDVFKVKFARGEFDMVVYNKDMHSCDIYEIKHSFEQVDAQYQHLVNSEYINLIEKKYGKVNHCYVLYRGAPLLLENGIEYLNVNEYLKSL